MFSHYSLSNPFYGTWRLVSGEYVDDKKVLQTYDKLKLESLLVLSDTHYSFVTMSNGKFWGSGAGRYSYTGELYSETTYTSDPLNEQNFNPLLSFQITAQPNNRLKS